MTRPIEINARFLTQPVTGVQRFAVEMVRGLDQRLAESARLRERLSFRLLAPRAARDFGLEHIPLYRIGRLQGHSWEQLELPVQAGRRLLLNLGNSAPVASRNIVAVHDAGVFAVPEAYSPAFRWWYRALIPFVGRGAVRVVTISEFSRAEPTRRARIPQGKLEVVPQGCEHIRRAEPDRRVFQRLPVSSGGYLLAVGSASPHKNLGVLSDALARLGDAPPLVIAGAANPRIFGDSGPRQTSKIFPAGYVSDAELRALYEGACGFVFPSRYEGFGLPPLEAMSCGCPVIVSRAAALPEVCGDAALYCQPDDVADLARAIRTLIQDPALQSNLKSRGLQRSQQFNWERASHALVELIERVSSP